MIDFLTGSPAGIGILSTLLAGLGAGLAKLWQWWTTKRERNLDHQGDEKEQLRLDLNYLRHELDQLRARVADLERKLIRSSTKYHVLYNYFVKLKSKTDNILGAIDNEGSDESKEVVNRILNLYGESLDDFDSEAPLKVDIEPFMPSSEDDISQT